MHWHPNSVTDARSKSRQSIAHHFKVVLIMLLVAGFDYEFYSVPRIYRGMIAAYCIFLVTSVTYATFTCCLFDVDDISQAWSLLEYGLTVCMLLVVNSKISLFLTKLKGVDCNLRINFKHYRQDNAKLLIHIAIIWFIRIVYIIVHCLYNSCSDNNFLYIVSQYSAAALDLLRIWRVVLFDMIRYRLKTLRRRLREDGPGYNFYLHVDNKKTLREEKIRFCMLIYKKLDETFDLITPGLFSSLLISVVCVLPKLIVYVYSMLLLIVNSESLGSMTIVTMHLVQMCFYIFAPCVVAEMYTTEVENIRLILMHKMMEEKDSSVLQDVRLFLRFTEIRPFQYKIWRILPINLTLPLEILNLCTTYVIVLINFTHLY